MWHLIMTVAGLLVLWTAAHFYVGHRLTEPLAGPWKRVVRWMFAVHGTAGIAAFSVVRMDAFAPIHPAANWVGYAGAGVFTLMLVFTVLRDLGWLGVGLFNSARRAGAPARVADPGRRRWMKLNLNAGVVAATAVASRRGIHQARKIPDVVDVTVPMESLPPQLDGFRIVQISDLHVGQTIFRPSVEGIVERVESLNPDMVAITGDIAEGYTRHVFDHVEPILQLDPPEGIHYVTGNHEYYWDAKNWCEKLDANGVNVHLNDHTVIERDGARLLVAGCTDYKAGRFFDDHATDPTGALEGAVDHDISMLLAHQPTSIFEAASAGYDLQLSGHTHGGQFWPWNYIAGMVHKFKAGLGREEDTWIYVSRGTGYWGPPVRLAAPSEITVITLRRGGEELAEEERRG